ncbi:protein LIFEGUARD 3-like isoform X2 [Andrographis paniculata]|uniref:protein LIFEGUARD 3-like isoform X2 n=1 Tax=Andrographis paniculata TaxID=175694 RepID=UPI0021E96049|nr:protein LIFEGUARD 3-like isoform X2 [Andrographis paniculata]
MVATAQLDNDVEAGMPLLRPLHQELHWAFIRKVYAILTIQLLATIFFASLVVSVPSVGTFIKDSSFGLGLYIAVLVLALIVAIFLYCFQHSYPVNFILLGIFTLCYGFVIGMIAAFANGNLVIQSASVTILAVFSLTAYTIWASRRGQVFSFLLPFLITILVVVPVLAILQIFFPMGKVLDVIYSGILVLLFCALIIYHTAVMIKSNSYDDYIWASVSLYLSIINLFLEVLSFIFTLKSN